MIPTLTAPIPSAGLNKQIQPRVLGAQFGDGYGSTTPDGINTMLLKLEPTWKILPFDEADALDTFFRAQGSARFYWTLPRETIPRLWRCISWNVVDNQTTSDVSAKFEEQPPL